MNKKKRYSHEEIAWISEAEANTNKIVEEFCRAQGVYPQTYYGWKKKFGGMSGDDVQRLRQLEQENARLKRALADAMLDNQILKELNAKNVVGLPRQREAIARTTWGTQLQSTGRSLGACGSIRRCSGVQLYLPQTQLGRCGLT